MTGKVGTGPGPAAVSPPVAALLELTHRCPLQCPYCSNPLKLEQVANELTTQSWLDVIDQLADLGVLQVHLSGGEPTLRQDLADIVHRTAECGIYSNLITSGAAISRARFFALVAAGLDHAQLSFQDSEPASAARISHVSDIQERKLAFAGWVREAGLPLTVNVVMHRHNIDRIDAMIRLAVDLQAARLEVAHAQYYGWALANRDALMPSREQLDATTAAVVRAREEYRDRLVIDYVVPDYYARQPKACMGGWAQRFINITPSGTVLPCHAAETISELEFDSVAERRLQEIWYQSPAFQRFRGIAWMPELCRNCDQREVDWGGCRCQALAITGIASEADPACAKSPRHHDLQRLASEATKSPPGPFRYRHL